jgi:hypothetical protein
MRFVVLLVALLGGLASAFVGYMWYEDWRINSDRINADWNKIQQAKALMVALAPAEAKRMEESSEYTRAKFLLRRGVAAPFFMAGLLMGVFGGILAMERRGFSAALVLLTGAVGPFVVLAGGFNDLADLMKHGDGIGGLIWMSGLFLAAFLSLFVWAPRPKEDRKAKARKKEEEEEEEEDRDDDEPEDDDD